MSKHVLVTGAAGFIGSHVTEALVRRGDTVVGLDSFNDYYDPARKRENVAEIRRAGSAASFQLIEGDIRDRVLVQRTFAEHRFDAVVHLAALAGVRASMHEPALYYDVNVQGTLVLLDAARDYGLPSFVFASSSATYGNSPRVPFVEDDPADRPLAPYPASKRSVELLGHSYHHLYGLDFTALRFFTVYGPRGRPDMMPWRLLDSIHRGDAIPYYNEGKMLRDWTYVEDTAKGIVSAVDQRLGYEIVNLGRGEPGLVADFVRAIELWSGKTANLVPRSAHPADVEATHADISKARRLLGYEPMISIDEGVRRLCEWYRERVGRLGQSSAA